MTGIITWLALGVVAGALAQWILPARRSMSWITTIILGVLGAFVGGYIGSIFGVGRVGALSVEGIITATGGALVLLFFARLLRR